MADSFSDQLQDWLNKRGQIAQQNAQDYLVASGNMPAPQPAVPQVPTIAPGALAPLAPPQTPASPPVDLSASMQSLAAEESKPDGIRFTPPIVPPTGAPTPEIKSLAGLTAPAPISAAVPKETTPAKEAPKAVEKAPEEQDAFADENKRFADAAQAAAKNSFYANLAGAMSKISAGIAGHGAQADTSGAEMLLKTASLPLDVEKERQINMYRLAESQKIAQQLKNEKAQNDPTSEVSKAARAIAVGKDPSIAKTPGFENLSFKALADIEKGIGDHLANQLYKAQIAMIKQQQAFAQQDKQQTKLVDDTGKQIMQATMRGPALAATNASRAADNALKLITEKIPGYETMPKEQRIAALNKVMSLPEYKLFGEEVVKAASGGRPSIQELKGVISPTVYTTGEGFFQYFSGNPQASQSGEFIDNLAQYMKGIRDVSHQYIADQIMTPIHTARMKLPAAKFNEVMKNPTIKKYADFIPDEYFLEGKPTKEIPSAPKESAPPSSEFKRVRQGGKEYWYNPRTGESKEVQ